MDPATIIFLVLLLTLAGGSASPDLFRIELVKIALSQVNTCEQENGKLGLRVIEYMKSVSNYFVSRLSIPPQRYAWCVAFVSWVYKQAGKPLGPNGEGFVSSQKLKLWFESLGRYQSATSGYVPSPGDVCFFATRSANQVNHVAIVVSVRSNSDFTIVSGNDSKGKCRGVVLRRISKNNYYKPSVISGFGQADLKKIRNINQVLDTIDGDNIQFIDFANYGIEDTP